jgi:hypothetical protein
MFAKIAVLLHSKVAIAIVGGLLVAGTGGVVATAATGQAPVTLIANATRLGNAGAHNDSDDHSKDDHSNDQGKNAQNAHVEGTIASLGSSSFVLTVGHDNDESNENDESGEQHDANDDHGTPAASATTTTPTTVNVTVNEQTKFEGVAKAFGDLKVGMQVEVQGVRQTDGSVLASQVESGGEDTQDNEGQHENEQEVSGTVLSVGVDSFSLKTEHGTKTITVSKTTIFDGGLTGLGDLKVGKQVEVKGALQSDGSIAATRVHGEDSGSGGSDDHGGSGGSGSKGN